MFSQMFKFVNQVLPAEVTDYIESLSSETRKLEVELRDCDELLRYSPRKPHGMIL